MQQQHLINNQEDSSQEVIGPTPQASNDRDQGQQPRENHRQEGDYEPRSPSQSTESNARRLIPAGTELSEGLPSLRNSTEPPPLPPKPARFQRRRAVVLTNSSQGSALALNERANPAVIYATPQPTGTAPSPIPESRDPGENKTSRTVASSQEFPTTLEHYQPGLVLKKKSKMLFAPKQTADQGWQSPDSLAPLVLQYAYFSQDGKPAGEVLRIDHTIDGGYAPYKYVGSTITFPRHAKVRLMLQPEQQLGTTCHYLTIFPEANDIYALALQNTATCLIWRGPTTSIQNTSCQPCTSNKIHPVTLISDAYYHKNGSYSSSNLRRSSPSARGTQNVKELPSQHPQSSADALEAEDDDEYEHEEENNNNNFLPDITSSSEDDINVTIHNFPLLNSQRPPITPLPSLLKILYHTLLYHCPSSRQMISRRLNCIYPNNC